MSKTPNSKLVFAQSKNGIAVVYDPVYSHASTHFNDDPQIKPLVQDILKTTDISGEMMEFTTDIGRHIGESGLVETDDSDEIIYAIRKNRDRYARFTKTRKPEPSSLITISLTRIDDKTYDLYSAWLGPLTPSFPGSPHETADSKPFWNSHALVWGTQEVQPGTETKDCPW
jgi:hypothetical protein